MRLFIDNTEVDMDQNTVVSISLSIISVTKIETGRIGYSKTIKVPMSTRNMEIMGDADQISSVAMFNQASHTARIEEDGCTVIEGALQLIKCEKDAHGEGWYYVNIVGPGKLWVKLAAENMFNEIGIEMNHKLGGDLISQSWKWDFPVKYLPVQRDTFYSQESLGLFFKPSKVLSLQDYHPFLNVKALMESIFSSAGFKINSAFMETDFFKSLYMSGNYPQRNVSTLKERMNFKAGRFASATNTADRFGRVYANALTAVNSVGNIVDTADPQQESSGKTINGVFNTNNCFQTIGNRVAFVPTQEVVVGFEYDLRYSTQYYMKSREELGGFNLVNFGGERNWTFKLVNKHVDRKTQLSGFRDYTLVVFDHQDGDNYQFRYTNASATVVAAAFGTRSATVAVVDTVATNPLFYVKRAGSSSYVIYDGDWALYDGYVTETGMIDVEVTVRSEAEKIMPSSPKYFNNVFIGGAEPGMKLTLGAGTTLRPVFMPSPGEGSTVTFTDIAAHQVRQITFVNAIKHMFNLCFYTDSLNNEVYIEPRPEFYDKNVVVDWTHRIDLSKPIVVDELGTDLSRIMVFNYQDGEGSTARWNHANSDKLGQWKAEITNVFAKDGENAYQNPLFTPSINMTNVYDEARAASFLQVGDRNTSGEDDEELNFPAKIVSFAGFATLPDSQLWGWPSYGKQYPFVTFHYAGDMDNSLMPELAKGGLTLCFEDRDGLKGLNRYYDKNIEMYNNSRRVTLYLDLSPEDIEPLLYPNRLKHDYRALYMLKIDGETCLYILEEVSDYCAGSGSSSKCVFIKYL